MKFFKLHLLIGNQEVQKLNTRSRFIHYTFKNANM